MVVKSDLSPISDIPVALGTFDCGCWGKHQPPYIKDGVIVIDVGVGYKSSRHLHGQNIYVIDVDRENHLALIEIRKYGDMYGAGIWDYLLGVDNGIPWICHVPSTLLSVLDAVEYLKPAAVKRAINAGLKVKRQGDWYFVPVKKPGQGKKVENQPLDDDHVADQLVIGAASTWVLGEVHHNKHDPLLLDVWHKAIRNRSIRHGRFGQGLDAG